MKIHLFLTCLNDAFYAGTGIAVTQVLERLGHEIIFDKRQTCCGQVLFNAGYAKDALRVSLRWEKIFQRADFVVSPSASCVAFLREHMKSKELASRTFEFSDFLMNVLKIEDVGATFNHSVTYHPTCHGSRMLGLGMSPVKLLKAVRGLKYVELSQPEQCCGFGGTFSVTNSEVSTAMMLDKIATIEAAECDYCAAVDNSCLMHLDGGLRRQNKRTKAIHLAEILASQEGK